MRKMLLFTFAFFVIVAFVSLLTVPNVAGFGVIPPGSSPTHAMTTLQAKIANTPTTVPTIHTTAATTVLPAPATSSVPTKAPTATRTTSPSDTPQPTPTEVAKAGSELNPYDSAVIENGTTVLVSEYKPGSVNVSSGKESFWVSVKAVQYRTVVYPNNLAAYIWGPYNENIAFPVEGIWYSSDGYVEIRQAYTVTNRDKLLVHDLYTKANEKGLLYGFVWDDSIHGECVTLARSLRVLMKENLVDQDTAISLGYQCTGDDAIEGFDNELVTETLPPVTITTTRGYTYTITVLGESPKGIVYEFGGLLPPPFGYQDLLAPDLVILDTKYTESGNVTLTLLFPSNGATMEIKAFPGSFIKIVDSKDKIVLLQVRKQK